ncbi:hypothetical protein PYCC9005_004496 [Savitreella phatthalungensis]
MSKSYTDLLNELNKEVSQRQPDDVLQFCAAFFLRKLDEERQSSRRQTPATSHAGSLASAGTSPAIPRDINMETASSKSSFPGGAAAAGAGADAGLFTGAGFGSGSGGFGNTSSQTARTHLPSPGPDDEDPGAPSSAALASTATHTAPIATAGGYSFPETDDATSHFHNIARGEAAPVTNLPPRQQSPEQYPATYNANRRTSVSAESMLPSEDNTYQRVVVAKSADQMARIDRAISRNLLFKNLDEEQLKDVLNAMSEKRLTSAGSVIIKQGDVGDFFYVVESGRFDIFIDTGNASDQDDSGRGYGKKVAEAQEGGSFGELALMYNAPRAATVISSTPNAVLWALDRITFRRILMENTSRKRRMYESLLETVPILRGLSPAERQKVADSLDTCVYEKGATVIRQGDVGEQFFIIESGEAEVSKVGEGVIARLTSGDYFGESALINDAPRNATIVAASKLKLATLGKRAFVRLLGPVMDILKRDERTLTLDEGVDPTSQA